MHHESGIQIKREVENNGHVLLEMNCNHNMETESWLNFETEEELTDGTQTHEYTSSKKDNAPGELKTIF